MQEFIDKVLFFEATYNTNINKQSVHLFFCHLDAWMLVEGKGHEIDVLKKKAHVL